VAFGNTAATSVAVNSSTSIVATTPPRSAGTTDVIVTVGGRSATLPGAFTFIAPTPTNQPPVLQRIDAQGGRRNEPSQFADLNEEITVSAQVTDAETAPDALTYEWSSDQGTFTGTGRSVRWRAPVAGVTPRTVMLKLAVVERFQMANGATQEHRIEGSTPVEVHNSEKEVGDMATRFLENFSNSLVPASAVMADFRPTCYGTAEEKAQVEKNRLEFIITSSFVGPPTVTVSFGGICPFRGKPGDACSNSPVRWVSDRRSGGSESVAGFDQVAAVYREQRWWLCDSQFDGRSSVGSGRFLQLLTGPR
jgi:hypothetical protein